MSEGSDSFFDIGILESELFKDTLSFSIFVYSSFTWLSFVNSSFSVGLLYMFASLSLFLFSGNFSLIISESWINLICMSFFSWFNNWVSFSSACVNVSFENLFSSCFCCSVNSCRCSLMIFVSLGISIFILFILLLCSNSDSSVIILFFIVSDFSFSVFSEFNSLSRLVILGGSFIIS